MTIIVRSIAIDAVEASVETIVAAAKVHGCHYSVG